MSPLASLNGHPLLGHSNDDARASKEDEERVRKRQETLKLSLNDIGLSVRTVNALENDDEEIDSRGFVQQIHTVEQLLQLQPEDILAIKNLGSKTLEEIYTCLAKHGFVRKGFEVVETEKDRQEQALKLRRDQLFRRIGYRR